MLPGMAAAQDGPGGWTGHSVLQVWEGLKWTADITLAVASRSCYLLRLRLLGCKGLLSLVPPLLCFLSFPKHPPPPGTYEYRSIVPSGEEQGLPRPTIWV